MARWRPAMATEGVGHVLLEHGPRAAKAGPEPGSHTTPTPTETASAFGASPLLVPSSVPPGELIPLLLFSLLFLVSSFSPSSSILWWFEEVYLG